MKAEIGRSLSEFWEARTPREKTILMWGGIAVGLALVYLVLWAPAYEGRARLRESLPTMQRQLATMTAQANDARSLAPAAEGVMPTGAALRDALAKSLADNGMQPTQVQVIGAAVQIQLKNASFPNWTAWLDDARKQFKVQVSEAHVTALKPDGQVDLTASLQPAGTK
ncbi:MULTISPECIES: type II secretion system protein M [Caballeronia]|uniref:General secretion pathway protein GspM n=1 Tax=Caballeronia zhejiangensis TaxID=871203 RepID=A0A656QM84_9BURK|nr:MULTISPECIES: type II secretion system protein M [Caballeronia]EKS69180.1 general secretion pathway M protein [Burkholderia sp. SJ98]KDR29231.1 general secretion pathway protein GspM [Caballeronia zhejiangensis]MCG7399762.1 type II secretion system protein M [Caballeronia zhejiangensis]MCI1041685.1 type II secretion system protein M [Caballeronia zhejiangensis]MDR5763750.1 type II secretion system protein M [Caballeronia sp. LZ028]